MDAISVPAELDSLSPIAQFVLRAAAEAGLDRKASYRLRLAVDEIATNVIDHGYLEAGLAGEVVVEAEMDERTLTITVEDGARPFDPRDRVAPEQITMPVEERPVGGLGIFLAVRGVDEFRYERAAGRNRNILVMNRPG
jgi:serine/threonine-protein kinase RsbW